MQIPFWSTFVHNNLFASNLIGAILRGLPIDNNALLNIRPWTLLLLSRHERKFLAWYKKQRALGLISIHFTTRYSLSRITGENIPEPTQAELCKEFLVAMNAPTVPDPEVLGKYSPPPL